MYFGRYRSKRKSYTTEEKLRFHKSRIKQPGISKEKKAYSWNWVDGYNDPNYRVNLVPGFTELAEFKRKKIRDPIYENILKGWTSGMYERNKQDWIKKRPYK